MATRLDNNVTLNHADANVVSRLLSDYAARQRAQARRTRSAAVQWQCDSTASQASRLAQQIVQALYTWE